MQSFETIATQSTPTIRANWDEGTLFMEGDSYPENSYEQFRPVFDWIEAFLNTAGRPLLLDLHLLYLNTSSIKAMMDIFDRLESAHAAGQAVSVRWCYDRRNERVGELAEEFREDCSFPFAIEPSA